MSRRARQKRWGIRTLLFLALAAGSVITSNYLRLRGDGDYDLLPFLGMVVGLVGATVCSIRGLLAWGGRLPRE